MDRCSQEDATRGYSNSTTPLGSENGEIIPLAPIFCQNDGREAEDHPVEDLSQMACARPDVCEGRVCEGRGSNEYSDVDDAADTHEGIGAFRVRSLAETTSTNDEVKRALEAGEPEGLVVCARRQVAGYGRQGRLWMSPDGGLYCSLLLRPKVEPVVLPTLSLVVGVAVRRALGGFAPHAADRIRIKWPNDVVLLMDEHDDADDGVRKAGVPDFAKLCGISLEAHARGVCAGVGVNVLPLDGRANVGGKNAPAYLADLAPHLAELPVDDALALVRQGVLEAFAPLYDAWLGTGFAPLADDYQKHEVLAGCCVRMVDQAGNALASGQVVCVDSFGRLVLRDEAGAETPVSSGEAHIA